MEVMTRFKGLIAVAVLPVRTYPQTHQVVDVKYVPPFVYQSERSKVL